MDWRGWLVLVLIFFARSSPAADIPWKTETISITAEKRDIVDILKDLAADQGINIELAEGIKADISGRFDGRPADVLDRLTLSNGLVWYFDGTKLFIYPSKDVTTQVYQVRKAQPSSLTNALRQIGVYTERYPIRVVDEYGLIYAPGPPRYQELVSQTLNMLESANSTEIQTRLSTRVYRLRYAWADDQVVMFRDNQVILPGLATTIRNLVNGQGAQQQFTPGGNFGFGGGYAGLRGGGMRRFGGGVGPLGLPLSTAAGFGAYPAFGAAGGYGFPPNATPIVPAQAVVPQPSPSDQIAAAQESLGPPSIQADRRLNAIIVQDIPSRFPAYEQLISELDVPGGLVEIEATILDLDADSNFALGPPWSTTWEHGNDRHTAGLSVVPGDLPTAAFTLLKNNAVQFNLQLQALQNNGHAEIVSRPTVLTLNNVEAQLDSTQTFFVRIAGLEQVDLFDVVIGTSLRVTPHIVEEAGLRKIQLIVQVEDGARDEEQQAVDGVPQIQRSTINTQALLNEEESLLIGGLTRSETRFRRQGIPWLKDIRFVGALFGKTQTSKIKTQRYILLKPKIIELPSAMMQGNVGMANPYCPPQGQSEFPSMVQYPENIQTAPLDYYSQPPPEAQPVPPANNEVPPP